MDLLGKMLANYRIDRLLGEGGMGAVYQAYDLSLQRDVAVKFIHPHYARQPNFRARFLQEARVMARLDHPGIVKVYTINVEGDLVYIVMEYIAGGTLRQLLDKLVQEREWLSLREALLVVQQLCQTLDYAHQHKILHRDIKPANLMLKAEAADGLPFRVVLTDLGLAKLLEGQGLTLEGTSLGTPAYMSPEQASGQETDPRSDVYSLGILLYELTVGRLPFPIRTITEAIRYHTKEQPPAPRSLRPDLPEAVERVILKALEKDPGNRYPSARELGTALAGLNTLATEIYEPGASQTTAYEHSLVAPPNPGEIDFMTALENGSTAPRGFSVFGDGSVRPSTQARIQVVYKDNAPQVLTLLPGTVTIGRDKGNHIVLNDSKASRKHAQITWKGQEYRVMDLNSTNGTILENTRLLPGVSELWLPNQSLRIGDTWLRLILPGVDDPGRSRVSSGLSSGRFTSSGTGLVGVLVTPQQLNVEAGGSMTAKVALLNQSPNVDHFSLTITGIPSGWIRSLPSPVELMPGEQKETRLEMQVPRAPQSRAGPHQMILRVTSQRDPGQFVEVRLTLTVAAYAQFSADLHPQHLRVGQTGRLTLANLGNLQETFTVQFTDAAEELSFQPSQVQLRVLEGGSAIAEFQAQLRQPRWLGGEKNHAFSAQVSLPQGERQVVQANVLSRALLPAWVPMLVLPVCLLLAGMLFILPGVLFPAPTPTATATLTETLTPSPSPEPGAPIVQEWCVYPIDKAPVSFTNCDIQAKVLLGTTLVIQWNVSAAEEVIIEPIGNQASSGSITYEVTENTTAISLKAKNHGKETQRTTGIIVIHPTTTSTPIPPSPTFAEPSPTASHTMTITPTFTSTPTPSDTPTPTFTSSPTAFAFP